MGYPSPTPSQGLLEYTLLSHNVESIRRLQQVGNNRIFQYIFKGVIHAWNVLTEIMFIKKQQYNSLGLLMSGKQVKKLLGKLKKPEFQGSDDYGSKYKNIDEMWKVELEKGQATYEVNNVVGDLGTWFHKGNQYWEKQDSTNDGVLGGFGNLSQKDTMFSLKFMLELFKENPLVQRQTVLDCGAGIGRITKQLLKNIYKVVDIVDQCEKYVNAAKINLQDYQNIRHFYCKGLQDLQFQEKYDCIWIQWVIAYLPDNLAVEFLERAKKSLNENGVIIVKENHCQKGFVVDKQDYSVTRSTPLYKQLFQKANLQLLKEEHQTNWPQDLFDLRMYALQ